MPRRGVFLLVAVSVPLLAIHVACSTFGEAVVADGGASDETDAGDAGDRDGSERTSDARLTFDSGASNASLTVLVDNLTGPITSITVSPSGKTIYWANGGVGMVDTMTRTASPTLVAPSEPPVTLTAATDDGVAFAQASPSNAVYFVRGAGATPIEIAPAGSEIRNMNFAGTPAGDPQGPALFELQWSTNSKCTRCFRVGEPNCGAGAGLSQIANCNGEVIGIRGFQNAQVFLRAGGTVAKAPAGDLDNVASEALAIGGEKGSVANGEVFWSGVPAPPADASAFVHRIIGSTVTPYPTDDGRVRWIMGDTSYVYWTLETSSDLFAIERLDRDLSTASARKRYASGQASARWVLVGPSKNLTGYDGNPIPLGSGSSSRRRSETF